MDVPFSIVRKNEMRMVWNRFVCCLTLWIIVIYSLLTSFAHADGGISLDTTRVVYHANGKYATLRVRNSDEKSSYLIQPSVSGSLDENNQQSLDFVVSPSLFRPGKISEGVIKIMVVAPERMKKDRESLYWVNVKAIPASSKGDLNSDFNQVSGGVKIAVGNTIKLLFRPEGLAGTPQEGARNLRFTREKSGKLKVINNSPFYISIGALKVNGATVKSKNMMMVAPFSGFIFDDVPLSSEVKNVSWKAINDNGGLDEYFYKK
ncbi:molecular chaperone [Escherichia coli]|nr:molecular chaperone [Escherichia coli]